MLHGARLAHLLQHAFSCSDAIESHVQNKHYSVRLSLLLPLKLNIKRNVIENVGWQVFLERWNRNLNLLGEVRTDSCALFRNFTRVTTSDFELLLQLIGPSIKKQDTDMREAIPISTRLDVTLRFLATGDSYHTLMYIFRISVSSISTIIPKVCQTVIQSMKGYVEVSKKVS